MNSPTRREALSRLAAGAAAIGLGAAARADEAAPAEPEPPAPQVDRRRLGATGLDVPVLGCGLATFFTEAYDHQREAAHAALHQALEVGANYFDTANAYGPSQAIIAPVVRERRAEVFLVSKSAKRGYDSFRGELERTLRLFKTDQLDLFHIHALSPGEGLSTIERGAVRAARRAKADGQIKAWGVTGHASAGVLVQAVRSWHPDCLMTVLSAERRDGGLFEDKLLPLARAQGMGVLAMKVMAFGWRSGLPRRELLRYALGLEGVACAVVGLQSRFQLLQNALWCTGIEPQSAAEQAAISAQSRVALGDRLPPWERPHYSDGVPEPEHLHPEHNKEVS